MKDADGMISTAAMPVLLYREVGAPRARRGGSITAVAECPLPELRHEDVPPPPFLWLALFHGQGSLTSEYTYTNLQGLFFFPSFIRSPVS